MSERLLPGLGILFLLPSSPAQAQTPRIDHQPVACATADKYPRLEARFVPAETVATARLVFQGQTTDWYSVNMKAEGAVFAGVLPKPKKDLKSFHYYIEVTDKALGTNRTAEYTTNVVDSASACKGKLMAGALGTASVILQGPAGVAALPAGFASTGVIAAGTAAGSGTAVGAAGAGAGGAGGGIGATALVIGGVAVAGGAAAVAASKGSDSSATGSSTTGSSTTGIAGAYQLSFLPSPPGLNVAPCGGTPGNSQAAGWSLEVSAAGNFDALWVPAIGGPALLRIAGQLTETSVQAALSCTNGALTGSMTGSGSNRTYNGTFDFGTSRGQILITKFGS